MTRVFIKTVVPNFYISNWPTDAGSVKVKVRKTGYFIRPQWLGGFYSTFSFGIYNFGLEINSHGLITVTENLFLDRPIISQSVEWVICIHTRFGMPCPINFLDPIQGCVEEYLCNRARAYCLFYFDFIKDKGLPKIIKKVGKEKGPEMARTVAKILRPYQGSSIASKYGRKMLVHIDEIAQKALDPFLPQIVADTFSGHGHT